MKIVAVIAYFVLLTTNVYADAKWIPIEPIPSNETSKPDSNRTRIQPVTKWIDNVKAIQRLLDHTSKQDANADNKKNWYSLDTTEDN